MTAIYFPKHQRLLCHWFARNGCMLIILITIGVASQAASVLKPETLTCEYIDNPLGIAEQVPRLTWTLTATGRNQAPVRI